MIGGVHLDDTPHYVFFDPKIRGRWGSIVEGYSEEQSIRLRHPRFRENRREGERADARLYL